MEQLWNNGRLRLESVSTFRWPKERSVDRAADTFGGWRFEIRKDNDRPAMPAGHQRAYAGRSPGKADAASGPIGNGWICAKDDGAAVAGQPSGTKGGVEGQQVPGGGVKLAVAMPALANTLLPTYCL